MGSAPLAIAGTVRVEDYVRAATMADDNGRFKYDAGSDRGRIQIV